MRSRFVSRVGLICDAGINGADTCWNATETGVSPVNGGCPVSNSYIKQPSE